MTRRQCRFSTNEKCALLLKESSLVWFLAHIILPRTKIKLSKIFNFGQNYREIFHFFRGIAFIPNTHRVYFVKKNKMIKFVVCPSRAIIPHSVFVQNTVPLKSLGSGFLCILICFCVFGL